MNAFIWILASLIIFIIGILALGFLLYCYREKLLINFSQKIWMTFFLGLTFGILFFCLNGFLIFLFTRQSIAEGLPHYTQHLWSLIRIGLGCFILNAFLILALRSIFKILYSFKKLL